MYFNLIKKSNNMNQQIMVQTRTDNRRKGRTGVIDSVHMSNHLTLKEDGGSSDMSEEDEEAVNASNMKKGGVSVPPNQTAKDGTPLI